MDLNPIVTALLVGAGIAGCAQAEPPAPPAAANAPAVRGDTAARDAAPEAETLDLLMAAADHEIKLAQMARNKGVRQELLEFADMIRIDHAADVQRGMIVAGDAADAAPRSTAVVAMQAKAESDRATLGGKSGAEFEAAWIAAAIESQVRTLGLIDAQLLPAARRDAVAAYLRDARSHVAAHLERARTLGAQQAPVTP